MIIPVLTFAEERTAREEFFTLYYKGEYTEAHNRLKDALPDPVARQIWGHRVHLQENLPGCASLEGTSPSARAFAQLSIGQFEEANRNFSDDWISHWGKAVLSQWNADTAEIGRAHV